jgi:polysaccharide chain length determinant protein (PEP-CTERM system associated)
MPLRPDMELQDYLQIFTKRKWIIIFSFLFVFLAASVYIVVTPKQYMSTTTIMVIPQKVPENFVQSTVTLGAESRLPIIQQQITSRTRLKKVMEEVGLFAEARKEGLEEEAIGAMSKRIEIEVAQDPNVVGRVQNQSEAFSLSFLHENPMLAMLTTSRLASLFIEENLKLREKQAVGTSQFLESQLKETKAKLDVQEAKVKQYKMQYSGGLPEELATNLTNMARLQQQEGMIAAEIRDAVNRKIALQTQLSMVEKGSRAILHDDGKVEVDTSEDAAAVIAKDLNERRNLLTELSAKYTDKYPDVVRLRGEVEELENKLAAIPMSAHSSKDNEKNVSNSPTYLPMTGRGMEGYRLLKAQISSIQKDINAMNRERETIRRNIYSIQARVSQAPRRDQELISLTRDYDNLKEQYNQLQTKKTEADISKDLEMRMKGDQFQILDPANLPKKPSKPKIIRILGVAFLMAGFLGFGGAIGMEKIDLSLRGVTDFKYFFDIPILASIPILETLGIGRQQKLRRRAKLAGIISFGIALLVFLLFFALKLKTF